MKISVVIPAHNERHFIVRAVESLVAQTLPRNEFEIIVVDNCSTDDTANLARDAGADLVVAEPIKGTNSARARGLSVAQAPIVAFLDADCSAPPDWLERILLAFKTQPHIVALGGTYDLDFDSQAMRCFFVFFQRWLIPLFIHGLTVLFRKSAAFLKGGNWAARREILSCAGIDTSIAFWGDDTDTACRLAKYGTVRWDASLAVRSSARRFRKEGTFRTQLNYAKNWFSVYFLGRPARY